MEQRRELRRLLESGTLRNHAISVLSEAYGDVRKQAAAETGLALKTFPVACDMDLDSLLDEGELDDDTSAESE